MNKLNVGDDVYQVDFDNEPTDIGISLFIRKLVVLEVAAEVKMVQPNNRHKFESELSLWDIYKSASYYVFTDLEQALKFSSALVLKATYYEQRN